MRTFLITALLSIVASLAWASEILTAEAAREAALAGELTVVDIRRPEEWASTGVADVAHTLDMTQPGFVSKLLELYQAHPDRPMALICASGARSTYAVTALRERGLDRLMNIREGMTGGPNGSGWISKQLPVRSVEQPRTTE